MGYETLARSIEQLTSVHIVYFPRRDGSSRCSKLTLWEVFRVDRFNILCLP